MIKKLTFIIMLIALNSVSGHSAVLYSENFESGTLGMFTDCPANSDSGTWTVSSDTTLLNCGEVPCEGAYYALACSGGWSAPAQVDIMYSQAIDISSAEGRVDVAFCWAADFMMFGNKLHFYASCSPPLDPCNPTQWTKLWSVETTSTCLSGRATVDLTPVVGCPVTCSQVYIAFGYNGTNDSAMMIDDIQVLDGGLCPPNQGENCLSATVIHCGETEYNTLTGKTNDYSDSDYNCSSGGDYSGGDIVYKLELTSPANVSIQLDDSSDTAIDVFVRTGCMDGTCVSWDDDQIEMNNVSGVYYIIVDCPSGHEAAYQLNVSCSIVEGDVCDSVIDIADGDCVCGSTVGLGDDFHCEWIYPQGPDAVYRLSLQDRQIVTVLCEADYYAADWGISTVCDASTGDIFCADIPGVYRKPSCSAIETTDDPYFLNFQFTADPGDYYIWVDGYFAQSYGNYCLEVICSNGDDCSDSIPINCGDTLSNDTSDKSDTMDADDYGAYALGNASGPDAWFHLGTVPENTRVTASVTANDIYILNGCTVPMASGDESASYISTGKEDFYLVVDSNDAGSGSEFDISVQCDSLHGAYVIGATDCDDRNPGPPFDVFYTYYETQYCIPAEDILQAGINSDFEITELAWYLCNIAIEDDPSNTVDIWLRNIPGSCPDLSLGGVNPGTRVVSARRFSGPENSWITFALDTPFIYHAGSNLLVSACDSTGTSSQSGSQFAINWQMDNYYSISKGDFDNPLDCDLTTDLPEDSSHYWTTLAVEGNAVDTPTPTETPVGPTPTPSNTPQPTETPTPRPGTNCAYPIEIGCGDCVCNYSAGYGNDFDCSAGLGHGGQDVVYHLTVDGFKSIQVIGNAEFNADWAIYRECDTGAGELICVDYLWPSEETACSNLTDPYPYGDLNYTFTGSGEYFIWLDGEVSGDFGKYCLEIRCSEAPTCTPTPEMSYTPTATPTQTPTPGEGNDCTRLIELTPGDCVCGDTFGRTNDHDCTSITPFEDHSGPDVVYHFTLSEEKWIHVLGEADYGADWSISTTCGASDADVLCADWIGTQVDPSCSSILNNTFGYINYAFTGSGDYYVWVDGYYPEDQGNYCLEILISDPPTATPTDFPSATPTPPCINNGDVNNDGFVTSGDAQLAFQIALSMYSPDYGENCRANCNGIEPVTSGDAQAIFKTALSMGSCADPL